MIADVAESGVAADELKQFAASIRAPVDRARYVAARARLCFGIDERRTARAFNLAARVVGAEFGLVRHAMQRAYLGDWSPLVDACAADVEAVCGFVYHAVCDRWPDRVKIGFSADIDRRAEALSSIHRQRVRIVDARPGTMLDEHVEHCRLSGQWIVAEWFAAPLRRAA